MKLIILSVFALFNFSFSAHATDGASVDSLVAQRNWDKLISIVQKTGTVLDSPYGSYLHLSAMEPADTTQSHTANYFSLVGSYGVDNEFYFSRVEVVSENWQLATDGNWHIDQWLYRLTPEGKIISGSHVQQIQTSERSVLKYESTNPTPTEINNQWMMILGNWYNQVGLD